jgi:uncharacterized protein (TIGR03435 family)
MRPGEARGTGGTPGGIDFYSSLRYSIAFAYGVNDYQVSGPAWLADARFQIVAKAPAGASRDQFPEMMRTLLAQRFQLRVHKEEREFAGFALVVGKDGPKLTRARAATGVPAGGYTVGSSIRVEGGGGGKQEYKSVSMEMLARNLTTMLGRPVADETGLPARYDLSLEYNAFDTASGRAPVTIAGGPPVSTEAEPGVSVFASIQKLGLRLEPRNVAGAAIVVEHAEKTPAGN